MKGDFSRNSFRPAKHYSGVRQQQGRVQLDADWNEQVDIRTHLARTHRRDTIGLAAVPHADGNFRISIGGYPDDFIIAPGRIYVDGLLCELEDFPIPITEFDPADNKVIKVAAAKDEPALQAGEQVRLTARGVTTAVECRIDSVDDENRITLDQDVSALSNESNPTLHRRTTYRHQPDYQVPSDGIAAGNTYLAYLDVWERHVTAIEDPTIREVALEGPDTATRTKTVWQVKVNLEDSDELESLGLSELDKWDANARPDRGMLTARCQAPQSTDQVYSLTSGGGYQGPENQLYRVEIHAGGKLGNGSVNGPTFKWSRDNGSVVTRWLAQDEELLTVESTGLDENFTFAKGQWIELTDDILDLQGRRGVFFQIEDVADQTIIIDLDTKNDPHKILPEDIVSGAIAWYDCFGPHRKIRRWDFTALVDMAIPAVDGATGDGWLTLENGIEVKFEPGSYRTGDYWLIPARRSKANIIWPADENDNPLPQPPVGIEHHYAPLAKLDYENSSATGEYPVIRDYRRVLRPLTDPQLEYLSGDGQEAKPGDQLPQPLRMGVFIGRQPVPEAQVRFEIVGGGGTLLPGPAAGAPGQTSQTLPTDTAGEVSCCWTLPTFYDAASEQEARRTGQRVKATLVDEAGRPLDDLPVYFTATLSLAEEVAYEPRGRGAGSVRQMGGADTVQKGLDRLDKIKVNTQGQDRMEGPLTIAKTLTIGKGLTVGSGGDKWEGGKPNTTLHGGLKVAGGAKDDYRDLLVEGSAMIKEDLIIKGNIIVKGDKFARDLEHVAGSMLLGNEPNDSIEFFGRLSSAKGQPALLVDDTLHVIDDVIVDGNLGIGTPSPGAKLDVAGRTFRLGSAVYQNESLSGEAIISSDGVHTDLIPAQDDVGAVRVRDGNSPGALTVTNAGISEINSYADTNANVPSSLVLQTNAGNVGIGTSSPGAKLDVRGDINIPFDKLRFDAGTKDGTAGIASTDTGRIYGEHDEGTETSRLVLEIRDNKDDAIVLRTAANSWDEPSVDMVKVADNVCFVPTQGNVGIGTTAPEKKLHIDGNCLINGNLLVRGDATKFYTDSLDVKSNVIRVNRSEDDTPTAAEDDITGLEVHRGAEEAAQVIWDEQEDCWKVGVANKLVRIATIDRLPSGVARVVEQADHGFQPGDAIRYSGEVPGYVKANSSDEATTGMFVVSQVGTSAEGDANVDCFTLVQAGYIDGLSGLTPGEYYFVSAEHDGELTAEESPLGISNPIFYAETPTGGYVLPYRPSEVVQRDWSPLRVVGADPEAPEDAIYVNESGCVGIGTVTPGARFDVVGLMQITGVNRNWRLMSHASDGKLYLRDDTAGKYRLTIDPGGQVGIGTGSPKQGLVVSNGKVGIGYNDEAQTAALAVDGDVGIGTTEPNSILHVEGPITTAVKSVVNGDYTLTDSDSVIFAMASAKSITITLPPASAKTIGRVYRIYKVSTEVVNKVTIVPSEGDGVLRNEEATTSIPYTILEVIGYTSNYWIVTRLRSTRE